MWEKTKAVEAILYLANRLFHPTKLQIFKLLYLADKLHLEKYGRFIIYDQYVAMKYGPVPSRTYDMLKTQTEGDFNPLRVGEDGRAIYTFRDADLDKFSQSDLECLDEILRRYGHVSTTQLVDIAHDQLWHDLTSSGERFNDSSVTQSVPMPLEMSVASATASPSRLTKRNTPSPWAPQAKPKKSPTPSWPACSRPRRPQKRKRPPVPLVASPFAREAKLRPHTSFCSDLNHESSSDRASAAQT